jgi:hypothetical protein
MCCCPILSNRSAGKIAFEVMPFRVFLTSDLFSKVLLLSIYECTYVGLQERVETVSAQGMGLDANMRTLRINYFEDCKFLLDNFSRIGLELKSYPGLGNFSIFCEVIMVRQFSNQVFLVVVKFRKRHLMNALRQCNSFIFHRMISKVNLPQQASQTQQPHPPGNREHRSAYNGHSYASHHRYIDYLNSQAGFNVVYPGFDLKYFFSLLSMRLITVKTCSAVTRQIISRAKQQSFRI